MSAALILVFVLLLPRLRAARFEIEPVEPGSVFEPLENFGAFLSGVPQSNSPGTMIWEVHPPADKVYILFTWFTRTQEILDQNREHILWSYQIDGVEMPLSMLRFHTFTQEDGISGVTYTGRLVNLAEGEHRIVVTMTIEAAINDGWNDFPPGDYVREYRVTIAP